MYCVLCGSQCSSLHSAQAQACSCHTSDAHLKKCHWLRFQNNTKFGAFSRSEAAHFVRPVWSQCPHPPPVPCIANARSEHAVTGRNKAHFSYRHTLPEGCTGMISILSTSIRFLSKTIQYCHRVKISVLENKKKTECPEHGLLYLLTTRL